MATTFNRLIQGQFIPVSPTTLYTSSYPSTTTVIKMVSIMNPTATPAMVSIFLVPFGSTPMSSDTVIKNETIGPNQSKVLRSVINEVLQAGDMIAASCTAINNV